MDFDVILEIVAEVKRLKRLKKSPVGTEYDSTPITVKIEGGRWEIVLHGTKVG